MEAARVASFVGIMLNACELFTNFAEEVDFLWAKSTQRTVSKCFYLYSRYYVFVVHLQHYHYAPLYQHLDPSKPTPPGMANWMLYKFFFWQTLVYVTDLVLCNRVYLLYNKRKAILYLLSTILVSRTLLVAISWYMIHTTLKKCTAAARDSLSFKVVGQYIGGEILMQFVLISLAFSRVIRKGPLRIFNFLAETGAESCICIMALILGIFIYSYGYQISAFIYPSCTGILSTICCRLILNMYRDQRIR